MGGKLFITPVGFGLKRLVGIDVVAVVDRIMELTVVAIERE